MIGGMGWVSLCQMDELSESRGKYVEIDGFKLAVFLRGGKTFVMDNECPHAGGSLAEGDLEGDCVVCPWHQWTFKLETGALRDAEGVIVTTYKTRVLKREGHQDMVQADLPIY
jgi:nitrite reductase/ring-hydroxylating ferredoxin subunit